MPAPAGCCNPAHTLEGRLWACSGWQDVGGCGALRWWRGDGAVMAGPPPGAAALAALLPPDVCLHQAWIQPERLTLLPAEAALVAQAVAKRRLEFAAGRHCARQALVALGGPGLGAAPLRVGPSRAPLWPAGVVGSISHDDSWCAAAVAWQPGCVGLGLDIELLARFQPLHAAAICTPLELQRWLAGRSLPDAQRQLARLFTIKEALFKAQHPITGAWLGFADVEVVLPDAAEARPAQFSARLLRPAGRFAAGQVFAGACAWTQERACAAVVLRLADLPG